MHGLSQDLRYAARRLARSPGFVIVATLQADPTKATGFDAAVKTLGHAPFGKVLLVVAALGIAAFGVDQSRAQYGPADILRLARHGDLLFGLREFPDGLALVGDLGLVKLLRSLRGRPVEGWETAELLEPYGEWAGIASMYLLAAHSRGLLAA